MRILAIRGCNLASLAGEFEIDLARPPFGGAGVFANFTSPESLTYARPVAPSARTARNPG